MRLIESVAALPRRRPKVALGVTAAIATNVLLVLIHNTLRTSDTTAGWVFVYLLLGMGIAVVAGAVKALEDNGLLPGILLSSLVLGTEINLLLLRPQLVGTLGLYGAAALDVAGMVCIVFICRVRFSRGRQVATIHQFPVQSSASRRHAA
jgi:hypothetical protein